MTVLGTSEACRYCQYSLVCMNGGVTAPAKLAGRATYCSEHERGAFMPNNTQQGTRTSPAKVYPLWMKPGWFMEQLDFAEHFGCKCDCEVCALCPLMTFFPTQEEEDSECYKILGDAARRLYSKHYK